MDNMLLSFIMVFVGIFVGFVAGYFYRMNIEEEETKDV